ncbi:sigma-70 family RNA polymerase sigma factor [Sphingomonas sp.]|uniref:sigma-70 family RNA polymerase sigma factor n=1 Tax=Sphingomonas sp. TaxID=28214 RepID=UPI003B3ACF36
MPEVNPSPERFDVVARQFRAMRGVLLAWFRRRVPDPSEAEDLLQESFLRVTQRTDGEAIQQFENYLYRTAQSVLADRNRRRGVRAAEAQMALEPDRYDADQVDALRELLAKEKLRRVEAVLMTLPERTRAIFILRRIEGLRYGEIAARFSISVSAVEKHMARAIEHLLRNGGDPA